MTAVNNERAIKIIEQQYEGFINLNEKWDFFRGLADYAKTLEELAPTKPIIEALEKQREAARMLYEQMNTQAFQELTKSAEQINKVAQQFAEQYEPVLRASKELQDHLNLNILSDNRLFGLNSSIFDVARRLKESGLAETIKKFEDNQREIKNIYGNYTFSPTYEKLPAVEKKLERQSQVETWGAWQEIPLVKKVVFEPDKIIEEVKKEAEEDRSKTWTYINLSGLIGEMEKIRSGEAADDDVYYFKVKDFRSLAQRLHNYIIAQLVQGEDNSASNSTVEFDPVASVLYFAGASITISKRAQNDAHDLLRTIFGDKAKVWNTDEVLADWHLDFDRKIPKNKVYQAGKAVNRIVSQETKVKDFLEVTTKTVAINKRYLPK